MTPFSYASCFNLGSSPSAARSFLCPFDWPDRISEDISFSGNPANQKAAYGSPAGGETGHRRQKTQSRRPGGGRFAPEWRRGNAIRGSGKKPASVEIDGNGPDRHKYPPRRKQRTDSVRSEHFISNRRRYERNEGAQPLAAKPARAAGADPTGKQNPHRVRRPRPVHDVLEFDRYLN